MTFFVIALFLYYLCANKIMMQNNLIRKLSAWVLLLVFVPTMLYSVLHRHHEAAEHSNVVCIDCVHHTPHAGHLSIKDKDVLHCVLCQILSLSYTLPSFVNISFYKFYVSVCHQINAEQAVLRINDGISPRAPPFCYFF